MKITSNAAPEGQQHLPNGNAHQATMNSRIWRFVPLHLAAKSAVLTAAALLATGLNRASAQDPDLIFSVHSSDCPTSGSWPVADPLGHSLSRSGSPSTVTVNGEKWEWNNRITSNDGWRLARYAAPLPVNGVTIVAAVRPVYCNPGGEARGEIVDIFYDRLALAVSHSDGKIMVCRNGWADFGPAIPNGQITVLSLVVQPNGSYQVFANGVSVMTGGANGDFSSSINPDHTATWGGDPDFTHYIDVGRNDPDGWSAFNGNIGDVYLYQVAIDATKRGDLEAAMMAKFGSASIYTINASAGTGGSITPAGAVAVPQNTSQTFSITSNYGYVLSDVLVDSASQGPVTSYAFSDVTADHTIAASWIALPTISGTITDSTSGSPINSVVVSLSSNPDGSSPSVSVGSNALGQYVVAVPNANATYYLIASKGGHVTSSAMMVTMTGSSVAGQDFSLAKSAGLDPLVVLDASTLAVGDNLAEWPNTGSLGGFFAKYSGGTGPNVVADIAGKQAVEFVQADGSPASRRTMIASVRTPAAITGNSDWTISTDLYRAAGQPSGENDYIQWAGGSYDNYQSALFGYSDGQWAYTHWGDDTWWTNRPAAGAWHNITITYDGSTEKLYVDGVLDRNDTGRTLAIKPGGLLMIGGRTWQDAINEDQYWRFNGAIAKLQIFDQALSSSEVATLAGAPSYHWAGPNTGNWSDPANWNNALPSSSKLAILSDSGAGAAIELDAYSAVAGIEFNNQVANTTIASSSAFTLSVGSVGIQVDGGSHTISAAVAAPSGLLVTGAGQLNLSGAVTSAGSGFVVSQVNGANVALNGSGSWTDSSSCYAAVGNTAGTTTLTINDSATLDWSGAASLCIAWGATGSGKVVQNGGTVKTPSTATAWYNNNGPGVMMGRWDGVASSAEYDLNGGTLIACNVYGINEGSGSTVLPPVGPVLFKFNGGVLQATQSDSTDASVISEGTNHLLGNMTHAYVGSNGAKIDTAAFNCSVNQALEHDPAASATDGGLIKNGAGTLTLLQDSSYTGTTKVTAGLLECPTATSLAATPLEISTGAVVHLGYADTRIIPGLKLGGVAQPSGVYSGGTFFTGTGSVTVVATSAYATWTAKYPGHDLTNPAADLDGDGMSNFQEFAFGLDPTKSSSVNPIRVPFAMASGTFSYTRTAGSGLTYTVLTSTNLATWSSAPASQVAGAPDSNGVETVAVTLTGYSPPAGGKLFVRVSAQ